MKFFLKVHKWLGLPLAFFLIVFSLSGIFLNHRQGIAKLDIPRSVLPDSYKYENWNNSAVKGTFKLGPDSILLYGGSGVCANRFLTLWVFIVYGRDVKWCRQS